MRGRSVKVFLDGQDITETFLKANQALFMNGIKVPGKVRCKSLASIEAQFNALDLDIGNTYMADEFFTNLNGTVDLWIRDGRKDIGWIPATDFEAA